MPASSTTMSEMSALDEIRMFSKALSRERGKRVLLDDALSKGKISESTYRHFKDKQELWKKSMKEKQEVLEETVKDDMRELEEELLLLERCLMRMKLREMDGDHDRDKFSSRNDALTQGIEGCREYLKELEEGLMFLRSISSEGIDVILEEKEELERVETVSTKEIEKKTEDFGRQLIVLHGSQHRNQSEPSSNDLASASLVPGFSPPELKGNDEIPEFQSSVVEEEVSESMEVTDDDYREEAQVEEKPWESDLNDVEDDQLADALPAGEDKMHVDSLTKGEEEGSIATTSEGRKTDEEESSPERETPIQDVVEQNPKHLVQRFFRAFIK